MNTNEKQLPELPETIGAGDEVRKWGSVPV